MVVPHWVPVCFWSLWAFLLAFTSLFQHILQQRKMLGWTLGGAFILLCTSEEPEMALKSGLFRLSLPWQLCKDAWFAVNSHQAYLITGLIKDLLNSEKDSFCDQDSPVLPWPPEVSPSSVTRSVKLQLISSVCFPSQGKVIFYVLLSCFFLLSTKAFDHSAEIIFCISPSEPCHGPRTMATPLRRSFK